MIPPPPKSGRRYHTGGQSPAMGAVLPLLLSVLLAAQASAPAAAKAPARPPAASARLEAARAQLKALMRDPVKRRYHHNWEKAIKALQASATGSNAPAATLEAARARYALYRWSANEADREAALRLARQAEKLGARDAARFAAAIRREAGDDHPAAPRKEKPAVAAAPVKGNAAGAQAAPPPHDLELEAEPELEAAVADLKAPPSSLPDRSKGAGIATSSEAGPGQAGEGEGGTRPVRRVVVDAGHGGFDPGAIGPSGVREKDVTLAIARKLAAAIDAEDGMRAVLIRDGDYFITLGGRTRKARQLGADMFVSAPSESGFAAVRPE